MNYRNFLFDAEKMEFDVRCSKPAIAYLISVKAVEKIILESGKLQRGIMIYLTNLIKNKRIFPLDVLPSIYQDCCIEYRYRQRKRESIFKNIVLQIITHNRHERSKPGLADVINHFRELGDSFDIKGTEKKKEMQAILYNLYSRNADEV